MCQFSEKRETAIRFPAPPPIGVMHQGHGDEDVGRGEKQRMTDWQMIQMMKLRGDEMNLQGGGGSWGK